MDSHFGVLGVARGASETEMKKAFKTKALQYHPDRNPNGAEMFKKINAAYEALTQHYKKNGGVDKRDEYFGMGGGSGGIPRSNSGRHWGSTGPSSTAYKPASSTPLFTEEELFGRMPNDNFGIFGGSNGGGGGQSTRQAYSSRTNGGGFRQSRQPPPPKPPTSSDMNDAANAAWREAHEKGAGQGRHGQPQSGYNAFKTEAESGAFKSQMKHFEEMERMKRAMGVGGGGGGGGGGDHHTHHPHSNAASPPSAPKYGRRSPSKFDNANSNSTNTAEEDNGHSSSSARPLPRQGSASTLYRAKRESAASSHNTSAASSSDPHASSTIPSYSTSHQNIASQRELEAEWAMERDRQARLKRAQEEMEATERRLRREQREAETRDEWERTQAEMEMERTSRQADERSEELRQRAENGEEGGHYVDETIKATALERRRERTEALKRLLPSKPLLDKMTIQELYILRELTNEFQSQLFSMTESRIRNQTMCLICHASKKDPRTVEKFSCDHCCICFTCSLTSALCPICGAARTDMD